MELGANSSYSDSYRPKILIIYMLNNICFYHTSLGFQKTYLKNENKLTNEKTNIYKINEVEANLIIQDAFNKNYI